MNGYKLREFQRQHTDWLGKPLVVDGLLGPRTRWALAISRLDPRRQAIVARACSFVGMAEESTNRGPSIDAWLRRCGAAPGNPWCAAFASWCLSVAYMPEVREASAQALGRSLRPALLVLPGDVMWFATDGWHGHCGIVIGAGPGEVAVVEGNHGNRVALVRRSTLEVRIGTPFVPEDAPGIPPGLELVPARAGGTR